MVTGEAIFLTASGICSVYEAEEKFRSKHNHFSGGESDTITSLATTRRGLEGRKEGVRSDLVIP